MKVRLDPQQRREQLLDVAAAMFAERPYDDVFVEDIAACAGVSRALLYHYFPSKRDLYVAIFKRSSHRLLARTNPDPLLPLTEQIASGLESHIQYFADHPFEAIAINRGALSDDPAIQTIITEELSVIGRRLTDKLVAEGHPREIAEIAVEGWLAFLRAACVKWVQSQTITRADLTALCLRASDCVLGYPMQLTPSPKEAAPESRGAGAFGSVDMRAKATTPTSRQRQRRNAPPDQIADGPLGPACPRSNGDLTVLKVTEIAK